MVYPLTVFPLDRYQKIGYGGPVGVFFDQINGAIGRAFIGASNCPLLRNQLSASSEVEGALSFYRGPPDVTKEEAGSEWEEIRAETKNEANPSSIPERLMGYIRNLEWYLN